MLELYIENQTEREINEKRAQELFGHFCTILGKRLKKILSGRSGAINLIFVNDETIHAINREYRKKDKPTDVISFAYMEAGDFADLPADITVGDVFVSLYTAEQQAVEKGHNLQREVDILFVHGLLHVMGFDHKTDEEEAEMEGWAKKILDF